MSHVEQNAISTNSWLWTIKSLRTFKYMYVAVCKNVKVHVFYDTVQIKRSLCFR